jgi:hypothetical protein
MTWGLQKAAPLLRKHPQIVPGDLRDERNDASEVREGSDEREEAVEGSCNIPGVGGVCKPLHPAPSTAQLCKRMRAKDTCFECLYTQLRDFVVYKECFVPRISDIINSSFSIQLLTSSLNSTTRNTTTHFATIKNHTAMAANSDKSKPYIPLASLAHDGYSREDEATATCFCGAVQLAFVRSPQIHLSTQH